MMMLNKNDQERVTQLLTDAITVLCKNGLNYQSQFCIEGLLGITLDEREVFLVKIDETVRGHGAATGGNPAESPTGITHHRTAVTSPRMRGAKSRGRAVVASRGRFSGFGNRKRNLFGGVLKPSGGGVSNSQSTEKHGEAGKGEPPSKIRLQDNLTPSTIQAQGENVIEIGGDEDSRSGRVSGSDVKTEPPDYPNTMPADSTQGPDSKYTLDNETSKNLTDFLDNLMTAHGARNEGSGAGGNGSTSQSAGSSSPAAAGSSALSHLAQMASPKSEPPSWEQQQYGSSISGSSPLSQPQQANGIRVKSEASDASESESAPNGQSTSNGSVSSQSDSTVDDHITSKEFMKNGHADSTHSNLFSNSKLPLFSKMPLPLDLYPYPVLDLTGSSPSGSAVFPSGDHDLASFYKPKLQLETIKKENIANDEYAAVGLPYLDPYTCRYCFKKCSGLSGLNKHVLHAHINPEEKPFQCLSCQKGFQSKALLNRHKKEVHLGIYPHHCKLCGKGFQKTSRLTSHMMLEHQFTCVACGLCCASKEELHKHLIEEHPRQQPGTETDENDE